MSLMIDTVSILHQLESKYSLLLTLEGLNYIVEYSKEKHNGEDINDKIDNINKKEINDISNKIENKKEININNNDSELISSIYSIALLLNFKDICKPITISNGIQKSILLQLVNVRNVNRESRFNDNNGSSKDRMLSLELMDGINKYIAVEYQYTPKLNSNLIPGIKLLFKNIMVHTNVLLITPESYISCEGNVSKLTVLYNMKLLSDNKRKKTLYLEENEEEPPQFIPLLADENKNKNIKENKSIDNKKSFTKENNNSKNINSKDNKIEATDKSTPLENSNNKNLNNKNINNKNKNFKNNNKSQDIPPVVSTAAINKSEVATSTSSVISNEVNNSKRNDFAAAQIIKKGKAVDFNQQAVQQKETNESLGIENKFERFGFNNKHDFKKDESKHDARAAIPIKADDPFAKLLSLPMGSVELSLLVLDLTYKDSTLYFVLSDEEEKDVINATGNKQVLLDLLDAGPFVSLAPSKYLDDAILEIQDDYIGHIVKMNITASGSVASSIDGISSSSSPRTYIIDSFDIDTEEVTVDLNNPHSLTSSVSRGGGRGGRGHGRGRGGGRGRGRGRGRGGSRGRGRGRGH